MLSTFLLFKLARTHTHTRVKAQNVVTVWEYVALRPMFGVFLGPAFGAIVSEAS